MFQGGRHMFAPQKILVPTDFSKYSDAALEQATDIATQYGSTIYLLHVVDERITWAADDYGSAEVVKHLDKESLKAAEERLKRVAAAIINDNKIDVVVDVKGGTPYEVILREEKEKNIDLIVIASHGKTGILKHLMGGVASKVIKGSRCLVVVVKP